MSSCSKCKKDLTNKEMDFKMICDYCDDMHCLSCAKLSTSEAQVTRLVKRVLLFACVNCIQSVRGCQNNAPNVVDQMKSHFETTLCKQQQTLIEEFDQKLKVIQNNFNEKFEKLQQTLENSGYSVSNNSKEAAACAKEAELKNPSKEQLLITAENAEAAGVSKNDVNSSRPSGSAGLLPVDRNRPKANLGLNNNQRNNNRNKFSLAAVNAGIAQVQANLKLNEVLNLGANATDRKEHENENGWTEVRRNRPKRRFVIGGNNDNMKAIQTVPKMVTLHVSRLQPDVNINEFETLVKSKFSEAKCEPHVSRYPEVYSSVKVTIKQTNLKDAWKKEAWPEGALVSIFRNRRKDRPSA